MRPRHWLRALGTIVVALLVALGGLFVARDDERAPLTDEVRRDVSGSFVRLPEGVVHYEMVGPHAGRTVVLVHGFSVPAYIWDPTFDALARAGYRVLRYDLYGRGYSDRPDLAYDRELFDRQLAGLLDSLDVSGPVDVMGLSMGGSIAGTFAARHPERVRTLTLVDPAFASPRALSLVERTPLVRDYLHAVLAVPSMPEGQLADFHRPEKHRDWPDRYRAQMRYDGFRRAILSTRLTRATLDERPTLARLDSLRMPVLLIWGEHDAGITREAMDDIRKAIRRTQYHAIADAGHIPHYERPEVVNPILLDFLARSGPSPLLAEHAR